MNLARILGLLIVALAASGAAAGGLAQGEALERLLHSGALDDQRKALNQILANPSSYTSRLQRLLREYPKLVRTEWQAANRAVYTAALLRDPSYPAILVSHLNHPEVLDQCIYDCSVVFALAVFACFGGWTVPLDLDTQLTTVKDLHGTIRGVQQLRLEPQSPDPWVRSSRTMEAQWERMQRYTEDQLIRVAGPDTPPTEWEARFVAVVALAATVTTSRNRIELYLLAMNDNEYDASGEYRGAVIGAILRAEVAKARGR